LRPKTKKINMNSAALRLELYEEGFYLKKQDFLRKYRSPNFLHKYKRYSGTTLRYAGGKSLGVGFIVEQLPNYLGRIISPFFGGGSFEIACAKELGLEVKGFDIFDILVNYWQVQIKKPEKLADILATFEPTNEGFKDVKNELKQHWKNENLVLDKDRLAALYYFNHNTSYGPGFLSWPSSVYMQEERYKKMVDKVRETKLKNISVECATFETVFKKYPIDFFYCDPPYFLDGDSKMFKGIYPQRNFPIHHNGFNHKLLRDLLLNHKGNFILSYNDCSTIREWYKDFEIVDVSWQYTMGQGETRIGKNRLERGFDNGNVKKSHEILIVKK